MKLSDLRWGADAFGETVAWAVPPDGRGGIAGVFRNLDGTSNLLHGTTNDRDHEKLSSLELAVLLKDYTPEVTEKGK